MGKIEIGFTRDEFIVRNFFYSEKDIAVGHVFPYFYSGRLVFPVRETAAGRRLDANGNVGGLFDDPFTLCRS
jgi:hypothetical protein